MFGKYWEAIVSCDASYDGTFYYGVQTTGIFCRPSCRSRTPLEEHVRIFPSLDLALSSGFRPCKRCRPDGGRLPDEEWVEQMTQLMKDHMQEAFTLSSLAERFYVSPYHLQRTFKRVKGITPLIYIQQVRVEEAKRLLGETNMAVTDVAERVGFVNAAYFSTLFQKKTGLTPSEYRNIHVKL